ncbi:1-phosphofructokinase family hexose kinase [Rhizobium sp. SSA_523]|uniref:1-phosphofructokinase family hexose kinase n=1 Tax=Rhizobium sp. SSA_523 TaxID=2952477 RepID=UPI0020913362|nr:hexose kinase [Rhizobium sp. SSA_523]MCO5732019.1 hexose kinase [Rhizobium sp. SSA_523]WKC22641.1 hexose kinase [Rhizobium sp. SSA_523]
MSDIVCITLNPTLDLSNEVDRVVATHKMRVRNQRQDVGGGGINVARVLVELKGEAGGEADVVVLSGGATGQLLAAALSAMPFKLHILPMQGEVRIAVMVYETETGQEYRFVPEGPVVSAIEIDRVLLALESLPARYMVASGSLPRGAAPDTYARISRIAARAGARFVLDASGEALAAALAEGGIYLFKPSLSELERLVGHSLDVQAAADVASDLVARGKAQVIALTLGADGAMLINAEGRTRLPAILVPVRSAVGAGDSFVGAMVFALSRGQALQRAFRFGLAAGAAAVMTPGTDLCRRADILALYRQACLDTGDPDRLDWVSGG